MKTLRVALPSASYPIHIGANILDRELPMLVAESASELVVVVTNETVQRLYPDRIATALASLGLRVETVTVPDGERYKTLQSLATVYDRLMAVGANRKTAIVAFGGGVVGDMAGYAAATFMRGVPLIQVPTTLLAQVDSSVGGKTGVNHPLGKNAIGAFKQPQGVVIDLAFLATLPHRELRAGSFELIKHGLIGDDALFAYLEDHRERLATREEEFWEEAVYRSCRVKVGVVEADERERDVRAILNFGHTLAHLIETHTGYDAYLHGEAVGVGMLFAGYVSREWERLSADAYDRLRALLVPLAVQITLPPLSEQQFAELLMHDKKAAGGTLRFVLLRAVGAACIREKTAPGELWPLFQRFLAELPGTLRISDGQ